MLVLQRNLGEEILVGADIVIKVVEVRGKRVRLGITAPKHIRVLRQEVVLQDTFRLEADDEPAQVEEFARIRRPKRSLTTSATGT